MTNKNIGWLLIVVGLALFAWVVVTDIVTFYDRHQTHIDHFCGTITDEDGSVEPIKISVQSGDVMSFDFRINPGKLELHHCIDSE